MTRPAKIMLGLATIWPLVYLVLFVGFVSWMMIAIWTHRSMMQYVWLIFPLHALTILWVFGLLAFYIVHLFRNERVRDEQKALWAVVILLGNIVAMPIYWYLYIWREQAA